MQLVRPCHALQHRLSTGIPLCLVSDKCHTPLWLGMRVKQQSHQHGVSQHISLGRAVNEVRLLVPCVEAGVFLKQRPVLLQSAGLRGVDGCANPTYVLQFLWIMLQHATSAGMASNHSSRCWPCSD